MDACGQLVEIPDEFRFTAKEVFIRRDPQTGDLILSQELDGWDEIYAALDQAGVPDDFLTDRR
jgi:antitoxin VapB